MSEIGEILQKCQSGQLGTPATLERIAEFEIRYGVLLPVDVKEFFLVTNGISHGFYDIYALENWTTSDKNEYYDPLPENFPDKQKYFVIGHYDILVWDWLIRLDADSDNPTPIVVTVTVKDEVRQVAADFTEFIRIYCGCPEYLL